MRTTHPSTKVNFSGGDFIFHPPPPLTTSTIILIPNLNRKLVLYYMKFTVLPQNWKTENNKSRILYPGLLLRGWWDKDKKGRWSSHSSVSPLSLMSPFTVFISLSIIHYNRGLYGHLMEHKSYVHLFKVERLSHAVTLTRPLTLVTKRWRRGLVQSEWSLERQRE